MKLSTKLIHSITLVALLAAIPSCGLTQNKKRQREKFAAFEAKWQGKSEADVLLEYGAPDKSAEASGVKVLTYFKNKRVHSENVQYKNFWTGEDLGFGNTVVTETKDTHEFFLKDGVVAKVRVDGKLQ